MTTNEFSPRNSQCSDPAYDVSARMVEQGHIHIGTHTDTNEDLYDLIYNPANGEMLRITSEIDYQVFKMTAVSTS